jgi:hypothetical protein
MNPYLASRPFAQLAQRSCRLGLPIPKGYRASLNNPPWLWRKKRKPVFQVCRSRMHDLAGFRFMRSLWAMRGRKEVGCPLRNLLMRSDAY